MGLAALALGLVPAFGVVPAVVLTAGPLRAQTSAVAAAPPPSSGGFFPLSEVRAGMTATAWTVFQGNKPEPMQVEILGVLRGARGPGRRGSEPRRLAGTAARRCRCRARMPRGNLAPGGPRLVA